MAPAKRKRPRFSADKSVHLLGSLSGSPTTNRRHTTRLDPIHDILPSPESRKRSRRSEPIPRRRRPRTRQNNRQLTSEPDEPEPEPRSDSIAEIFEEAESHKRSRIASDYEHAEEATRFQNGGEAQEEEEEEEEEEEDDDDYDEPPLFGDQNEADEDAAGHQLGMELSAEDAEETNTYSIDILGEYNDDEDEVVGYHLETEMDDENSDNEDIKSATPQNGEENESIGLSDHQNDEENLARHQLDIEMDTGDEHDEEGDDGGDGGEHDEDGDDMNENGSSGPVQGQGEANTTEDCRLPGSFQLPTIHAQLSVHGNTVNRNLHHAVLVFMSTKSSTQLRVPCLTATQRPLLALMKRVDNNPFSQMKGQAHNIATPVANFSGT
ncbi:hypothetical protein N7532_008501 [Penicillium argentinense]|uniref:Uncharacterized protein n=1 Tax=Penicillium argentinense TaxID=1131581 RepID=A0A9W9EXI8_9EURO|nr:uncharacterized protein N7532_008501 [Penicillium argentinense]KAJ5089817.1 hypothetical protein N7532_008501 [Penicillium argentinense]